MNYQRVCKHDTHGDPGNDEKSYRFIRPGMDGHMRSRCIRRERVLRSRYAPRQSVMNYGTEGKIDIYSAQNGCQTGKESSR